MSDAKLLPFPERPGPGPEAAVPAPWADAPFPLTCYLFPGWKPHIRPASPQRDWMDAAPEAFAYRCLPLNIANAHGWEVLSPCAFEAEWNGEGGTDAVAVTLPDGLPPHLAPVSIFGQGVLTFHIQGLFRTPPGWNIFVTGSPNACKDAIAPLSGVVETDWSPYTFTMNWRFTRPGARVRFEAGEPICFFFPTPRGLLDQVTPRFVPIEEAPDLKAEFERWSAMRDGFQAKVAADPPAQPSAKWQKHYYRGVDTSGASQVEDHQAKLRLAPFTPAIEPARHDAPLPPPTTPTAPAASRPAADVALRKRDWLLQVMEAHRRLAPGGGGIEGFEGLGREAFLKDYYAQGRPVVLSGEMDDWPALKRWTPAYLKAAVGSAVIEYQGDRQAADYELYKDRHRRQAPFYAFIDRITRPPGEQAYITAFNSARNRQALAPLQRDLGFLDKFLDPASPDRDGMMWIGPADTFTPLHHDLTDNFIAQVVGRKRVILAPPAETGRLANDIHVFSRIADLQAALDDPAWAEALAGVTLYDVVLEPGDILFMPIGWWHQVRALDFSVTLTYTNFLWRNDWSAAYPGDG